MSEIDDEIRLSIEKTVDELLKDPGESEGTHKKILVAMGIESNLETVISLFAGFIIGVTATSSMVKYKESRKQDIVGAIKLLRRRAEEIRHTFLRQRLSNE